MPSTTGQLTAAFSNRAQRTQAFQCTSRRLAKCKLGLWVGQGENPPATNGCAIHRGDKVFPSSVTNTYERTI